MKMNWGKGITLFMTGFVLFMGYLTYRAFSIDFDLVSDDYYAQEIAYEQRMTEMRNVSGLNIQPSVSVNGDYITVQLPAGQAKLLNGEVYFYDPIRREGDRTFALQMNSNGVMEVPTNLFQPQRYQVKVSWVHADTPYFFETPIDL